MTFTGVILACVVATGQLPVCDADTAAWSLWSKPGTFQTVQACNESSTDIARELVYDDEFAKELGLPSQETLPLPEGHGLTISYRCYDDVADPEHKNAVLDSVRDGYKELKDPRPSQQEEQPKLFDK